MIQQCLCGGDKGIIIRFGSTLQRQLLGRGIARRVIGSFERIQRGFERFHPRDDISCIGGIDSPRIIIDQRLIGVIHRRHQIGHHFYAIVDMQIGWRLIRLLDIDFEYLGRVFGTIRQRGR